MSNLNIYFVETKTESKKTRWPELVGKKGEEAVKIIKKETGNVEMLYKYIKMYSMN